MLDNPYNSGENEPPTEFEKNIEQLVKTLKNEVSRI